MFFRERKPHGTDRRTRTGRVRLAAGDQWREADERHSDDDRNAHGF